MFQQNHKRRATAGMRCMGALLQRTRSHPRGRSCTFPPSTSSTWKGGRPGAGTAAGGGAGPAVVMLVSQLDPFCCRGFSQGVRVASGTCAPSAKKNPGCHLAACSARQGAGGNEGPRSPQQLLGTTKLLLQFRVLLGKVQLGWTTTHTSGEHLEHTTKTPSTPSPPFPASALQPSSDQLPHRAKFERMRQPRPGWAPAALLLLLLLLAPPTSATPDDEAPGAGSGLRSRLQSQLHSVVAAVEEVRPPGAPALTSACCSRSSLDSSATP